MASGTLYDKAAWKVSWGIGNGLAKVDSPVQGFVMGGGAASGGNLRTALEGQSPGCREGPAPDMVCLLCLCVGGLLGGKERDDAPVVAASRGKRQWVAVRQLVCALVRMELWFEVATRMGAREYVGMGCGGLVKAVGARQQVVNAFVVEHAARSCVLQFARHAAASSRVQDIPSVERTDASASATFSELACRRFRWMEQAGNAGRDNGRAGSGEEEFTAWLAVRQLF